jgi:hypothetical protein
MVIEQEKKSHLFRDLFNDSLVKTNFCYDKHGKYSHQWNQICICMDTLENTEYAMERFFELGDFSYLEVYGFFQALYIQQDTIEHLYKIIAGIKLDLKTNYPLLEKIREKRNCYAGHPIVSRDDNKQTPKGYHGVSAQFSKFNIEVYNWFDGSSSYESIDLKELYGIQKEEINKILRILIKKMQKIKKDKQRLIKKLKVDFYFEKELFFRFFWKKDKTLSEKMFLSLKDRYLRLISQVKRYYGNQLESLSGLDLVDKEIEFCLSNFPGFDNLNIGNQIYLNFLEKKMIEFKEMLNEIKPNLTDNG